MNASNQQTILVTGVNGQIGFELVRSLQGLGRVVAIDRQALDLADLKKIRAVVRELRPAMIINPAAYTAVDQAEIDCDNAFRINAHAPEVFADEARRLNAVLIHYSTDHVFDGTKEGPYLEGDAPNPLNVYGASKLAGERAIMASGCVHLILRTSWVYGSRGKNFLLTMLRMATERSELKLVADQMGAPTWSNTVAMLSAHIVSQGLATPFDIEWWRDRSGIYHLTATDHTSWFGFASAIFELAELAERLDVLPIFAKEWVASARRPANSQMSNDKLAQVFGLHPPEWKDALRVCMKGMSPLTSDTKPH